MTWLTHKMFSFSWQRICLPWRHQDVVSAVLVHFEEETGSCFLTWSLLLTHVSWSADSASDVWRQKPVFLYSTCVLCPLSPECPRLPHDDGAHLPSKVGQVGVFPPLLRPVVILTEESPDVLWSFHSSDNFFRRRLLQYWWLLKWRQTSLNVPSDKNSFVFGQSLSFYR